MSMELAAMEWYSVLTAAMNTGVKDRHQILSALMLLRPNFDAPLDPPTTTLIINASPPIVDVTEHPTVPMEVTKEIAQKI